jgi:hypothetical protein
MSIFKELNDVNLDISEFDEIPLSEHEQKRIIKNVHNKIQPKRRKKKWLGAGFAAVAALVVVFALAIDKGTIANMPFVGETIEKYINENENLDYSSYKTAIGETAENELGKLTLNEVMMDDQHLFLSATFQPAENVEFDYQTHILPSVKVNGEDYTVTTGGQSIELNDGMFTIYNDIDLSQAIETDNVSIHISYDKWNFETAIEQPWTFDVEVSQAKLLAEKRVFEMNETITLNNGEIVTVEKVVTTPMSTTVYYDLSQSKSEDIYFDIQSEKNEKKVYPTTAFTSNEAGDVSTIRFEGLTLGDAKYFLIPRNSEDDLLSSNPIPIR